MSKRTFRAGGLAVAELTGGHHLVGQFDNYGCFLGRLVRFLVIPLLLAWPFGAGAAEFRGHGYQGPKPGTNWSPLPPLPAALCI